MESSCSYSIFDFSTRTRKVIIRVTYSIDDSSGAREQGTKYYSFEHSPIVNTWRLPQERNAISYYLNFI